MRVLVTTQPQGSHFSPMLGYLRALEAAGHELRVASGLGFVETITAAGLHGIACGLDWSPRQPVAEQIQAIALDGEQQRTTFVGFFTGRAAAHMAQGVMEIAERWRPDVILWESTEFGAPVAAERLDIPHLPISVAMRQTPAMLEPFAEQLQRVRSEQGLPADPERTSFYRHGCLSLFPPEWLSAREPPLPGEIFLAPFPDWAVEARADDWIDTLPDGPVVYATLGTIFSFVRGPLDKIIAALADGDWTVVVATGGMRDPDTLGPVPANTRVERWVAQRALLQRAALVVHHAGYSTCMDAVLTGVPQVVLPLSADQPEHADAVRRLGLGRTVPEVQEFAYGPVVDRERLSPSSIIDAARQTLSEPEHADRAAGLRERMRALPGPEAFVEAVERLGR